jgi:four helix bundle protein
MTDAIKTAADGDVLASDHPKRLYDLDERTAKFGESVIHFAKRIPVCPVTIKLIPQLIAAGTSVGANYGEADDAISKRDFRHRISICKKESRESKYWLRMVVAAVPALAEDARALWREGDELYRIFGSIHGRTKCE